MVKGLMNKFILVFCLVYFVVACSEKKRRQKEVRINQKSVVADTSLKILVTGLPDIEEIIQLDSLVRKYEVVYYPVGCVVSSQLRDSIDRINRNTYKILDERYGQNWKRRMGLYLDTIYDVRRQASLLMLDSFPDCNRGYYYLVIPKKNNGYEVKVYSSDSLNEEERFVVHFKVKIKIEQRRNIQIEKVCENL